VIAQSCHQSHRRRNADQRRTPHLQLPDGFHDRVPALEIPADLGIRERALIEDAHRTAGRP